MLRLSLPALLFLACTGLFACGPEAAPPAVTPPPAGANAVDPSICNVPPNTGTTPPSCPKGCVFDNGKCEVDRGPPVHDLVGAKGAPVSVPVR